MSQRYKVTDQKSFLKVSHDVHGDRYDYSLARYIDTTTKVDIKCPVHGVFRQIPSAHIRGHGCSKCAGNATITLEDFLEKSKDVHNDFYNYSQVALKTASDNVEIICPLHGPFNQKAAQHMRGGGCGRCTRRKLVKEDWVERFYDTHGDKYIYDKTVIKKSGEKAVITCPAHGDFLQTPHMHWKGNNCPNCAREDLSKIRRGYTEDFLKLAEEKHGNKYDYSKTEYIDHSTKVKIYCPMHGETEQMPYQHLRGYGCNYCGAEARKENSGYGGNGYYGTEKPANIYVFLMDDLYIKVGVAKNVEYRIQLLRTEFKGSIDTVITKHGTANRLFKLEQRILKKSNLTKYVPNEKFGGSTECLELSELPKVLKIIEEFKEDSVEEISE